MVLFSFVAGSLSGIKQVYAETTKTELINENYLKVAYDCEEKDNENLWRISFKRQSEDENFDQRLKLKVTDEKDKTIDYPSVASMNQKDEWLIEEKFSQTMEGQVALKLPKSVEMLQLYVQLDQREAGKEDAKIHEDTMEREKPFELKLKNGKDQSKEDVKKKEKAITAKSEDFVGAQSEKKIPTLADVRFAATGAPVYTVKEPVYSNVNGKHPDKPWQPTGQTNVINHQGSPVDSNGWDDKTSWDVTNDEREFSYIHYGQAPNPDVSLRKYASQTNDKGIFDVKVNVRGGSVKQPGLDIFFVLDNSASMALALSKDRGTASEKTRKEQAVDSLQELINKFKRLQDSSGNEDRIKIGGLYYANYNQLDDPTVALSSNQSNWDKLVSDYAMKSPILPNDRDSQGNTFTEKALQQARSKIGKDQNRRRVILLMTDGAPNVSFQPLQQVSYPGVWPNPILMTQYYNWKQHDAVMESRGSYLQNDYNSAQSLPTRLRYTTTVSNLTLTSHLTPAAAQAQKAKDDGIELHSIALGIRKTISDDHETDYLIEGMCRMASNRPGKTGNTQNDRYFYKAENQNEFQAAFEEWFNALSYTVDEGFIEDQLGDDVELVGDVDDISIDTAQKNGIPEIPSDRLPKKQYTASNKTISISGIYLHSNQEMEVSYQVRLKDTARDGKWYQANKETTLTPTPGRTGDVLKFGNPSVRDNGVDLKFAVEKVWNDKVDNVDNYWELRDTKVAVQLQQKNSNNTYSNFGDSKELNDGNNWQHEYGPVPGRSAEYKIKEVTQTPGYAKPQNDPLTFNEKIIKNKNAKVINNLLTGNTYFYKFDENGKPFTDVSNLPEFTVTRKDSARGDKTLPGGPFKPDITNGRVDLRGLPYGNYTLTETKVPKGYVPMKDLTIKVRENTTKDGVGITFGENGSQGDGYEIRNERKMDIPIKVKKVWEDNHANEDNYWGKRDEVEFIVEEKLENGGYQEIERIKLNANNKWEETFKTYDEQKIFRIKEISKSDGYEFPADMQVEFSYESLNKNGGDGTAKIKNKLIKGEASFYKFKGDGTPFDCEKEKRLGFTVRRKSDKKVLTANLKPDDDGKVTIKDIPIGEFEIEETDVPAGFEKMDNITLTAVEKQNGSISGKPNYVADITMSIDSTPVINKLKSFALVIDKVDQGGKALKGAKFKLTTPDGSSKILAGEGPLFKEDQLSPGDYTLTEIQIPTGYSGMEPPFRFTIEADGKVTFDSHSSVKSSYSLSKEANDEEDLNSINLTVTNKRAAGALPRTGGGTTALMFKIAFAIAGIAGLLGGAYWLYSKNG